MIHAKGLFKQYGDLIALDRVSFDVERGSVVGFLGPNGAGKSTTMKILTGTLVPDGGSCEVAGVKVEPGDTQSRQRVGYLPESTPLYSAMRVDRYLDFVAGVLGAGRKARRREVGRVIDACRIGKHAGRPIGALSKGYRQRVGLAQALLGDPDVLILDEPTSGLDPGEVVRMRRLIRDLGEQKTILLSTHILSEIEATTDRVIIISGGQLIADGNPTAMARGRVAELLLVLRLGIEDLDLDRAEIEAELMDAAGVKAVISIEAKERGVRRCLMRVERTPGSDGLAAEPVAEFVAERMHLRGWHVSELSWKGLDFEAAFLDLTEGGQR